MAALRRVKAQGQLGSFTSIGAELLTGVSDVCRLSSEGWGVALGLLEVARRDPARLPPLASLSGELAQVAARHYHRVYTTATHWVVLPRARWGQWREGLQDFYNAAIAINTTGEVSKVQGEELVRLCCDLLVEQRHLFAVAFWGCWSSVAVRLDSLLEHLSSSSSLSSKNEKDNLDDHNSNNSCDADVLCEEKKEKNSGVDVAITRLRNRYFFELYQFQKLAYDSSHLFGFYANIGKTERIWLSDKVLLEEENNEEAAESFIRRSFKRDFSIPSSELVSGSLLEEYNSFEVNESKKKVVQKVANDTLKSMWCKKSILFYENEVKKQQNESLEDNIKDKNENKLLDDIIQFLRFKVGKPYLALALMMHEILEKEEFLPLMTLSRLDICLNLLQQWFEEYIKERHHNDIPLFTEEDLWNFMLERYTEFLKLVIFYHSNNKSNFDVLRLIEGIRAVSFSVFHSLDVYISALSTKRLLNEENEKKKIEIREKIWNWIQNTIINRFLNGIPGLLSDLKGSNSSNTNSLLIFTNIEILKAQLMLLCDTSFMVMNARQILITIMKSGFEEMNRLYNNNADELDLTNWVMCMINILNMIRSTLHFSKEFSGSSDELLIDLHTNYRNLQYFSPDSLGDIVSNEWLNFLSSEGKSILGTRRVILIDVSRARRHLFKNYQEKSEEDEELNEEESSRKKLRKE